MQCMIQFEVYKFQLLQFSQCARVYVYMYMEQLTTFTRKAHAFKKRIGYDIMDVSKNYYLPSNIIISLKLAACVSLKGGEWARNHDGTKNHSNNFVCNFLLSLCRMFLRFKVQMIGVLSASSQCAEEDISRIHS